MPKSEPTSRELKLIQYLNEAYGKERQLETALQAQIGIIDKDTIKKRFRDHLKETKGHARSIEKRIKQLGGKAETVSVPGPDQASRAAGAAVSAANKAMAAAKGPVQALRGTSPADNWLRNVRDAFWNEAEEIAHYHAIEALAEQLKDSETAKLARGIRREEERMQRFLEKQIPQLVRQVVRDEIPAKERTPDGASAAGSGARRSRSTGRAATRSAASRSTKARSTAKTRSTGGRSTTKAASTRGRSTSGGSPASGRSSSGRASGGSASRARGGGSSRSRPRGS